MTKKVEHIPHEHLGFSEEEMIKRSEAFYEVMNKRRSIRFFSDKDVPLEIIENCINTASTAPSGAHKQPWTFCLISNKELQKKIRAAAEEEEHTNYNGRMSDRWLEDLAAFGTDWNKPFLEIAPYLVILFKKSYDFDAHGQKTNNYYVNESVGIAAGMLLAALHNAGLATLTHTPSPMNFLAEILERPKNEKAFLLIPVGYPTDDCTVPNLKRKPLDDVLVRY